MIVGVELSQIVAVAATASIELAAGRSVAIMEAIAETWDGERSVLVAEPSEELESCGMEVTCEAAEVICAKATTPELTTTEFVAMGVVGSSALRVLLR